MKDTELEKHLYSRTLVVAAVPPTPTAASLCSRLGRPSAMPVSRLAWPRCRTSQRCSSRIPRHSPPRPAPRAPRRVPSWRYSTSISRRLQSFSGPGRVSRAELLGLSGRYIDSRRRRWRPDAATPACFDTHHQALPGTLTASGGQMLRHAPPGTPRPAHMRCVAAMPVKETENIRTREAVPAPVANMAAV